MESYSTKQKQFMKDYVTPVYEKLYKEYVAYLKAQFVKGNLYWHDVEQLSTERNIYIYIVQNKISFDEVIMLLKKPLRLYQKLLDMTSLLTPQYKHDYFEKRGVPKDEGLALFKKHNNLILAVDEWYRTTGKPYMVELITHVLEILQRYGMEETEEEVQFQLYGRNMNPEEVILYFLKLKEDYDRAVALLPECEEFNEKFYTTDEMLNIIGEADFDKGKIEKICKGEPVDIGFIHDKQNPDALLKIPINLIPTFKWRYSSLPKLDKQCMDEIICTCVNNETQLLATRELDLIKTRAHKWPTEASKFLKHVNRLCPPDDFPIKLIQDNLVALKVHAMNGNKTGTLELHHEIFRKMTPLRVYNNLLEQLFKTRTYEIEFLYLQLSAILYGMIIQTRDDNTKKFTESGHTIYDYFKHMHPENIHGFHAMDARFLTFGCDMRQNFNRQVFNNTEVTYPLTRGGTVKHKKETQNKTVRLR